VTALIIKGRVWVFGDNISTDLIFPTKYKHVALGNKEMMGQFAMTGADPDFPKKVKLGDIIVAGKNFGCGSSREQAATALKKVGIGVLIGESFGRIFFRNCINYALPPLRCKGLLEHVKEGDELQVDFDKAVMTNLANGYSVGFDRLPDFMLEIIQAGGLLAHGAKILKHAEG
jgi:3-isopropylmalate/(R)-2-methylmalate dehydratase small subunit